MSGHGRGQPPRSEPAFIADSMLGRLARWLRILGYDTAFSPDSSDADIARIARREQRIVLTRDRGLAARKAVTRCILVASQDHRAQIMQVFGVLGLKPEAGRIFTRCPSCNRSVSVVPKGEIEGEVPAYVYRTAEGFCRCPECRRVFWKGSHHRRSVETLREIFGEGMP